MGGACSYIPLDDILPPSAGDTINNFREELDDDAEMLHPNQRGFPATKTGFQEFKRKFQRRIIMQQRYLEVIRNHARSLFPNQKQTIIADEDMAYRCKHDHIVNPATANSLANKNRTSSHPAAD